MKVELLKEFYQFRTKDFRQHGDNIQAAIRLDDQDFALFTSGINDLVLTFTDNEGEATNMCMVHIDPMDRDKKEITLAPHMWRFTLKCSEDDEGQIKITNDGCDVTECFDIDSKTIFLGMDPDADGTKWTCVKHPKKGLVLRVAKPRANTSLFKAILEDRLRSEGCRPEDLEQRLKKLKGFEKGYLGLHAVQLKAVIGDATGKSGLLRDNDEVAGKMEGLKLLPKTVIPFEMERSFKPNMVDLQLVNGEGEVVRHGHVVTLQELNKERLKPTDLVRHGLLVVVDGKLGYINLPYPLPEGSKTVRLVKPIKGHPADVLDILHVSLDVGQANQPDTKKRKVEGENLPDQYSKVWGNHPTPDVGDVANGDPNSNPPSLEELIEDLMEMENPMDERTLNSAVLESDGHSFDASMPPPRVEELKLWDPIIEDGPKLGTTNTVSKEGTCKKEASAEVTLPKGFNTPHYDWILHFIIFGAVTAAIAVLMGTIWTVEQD